VDDTLHRMSPFFILLFVWLIAFLGLRHKRVRSDARRDVQLALLNKFQSGEEITRFLATDEGKRLLDELGGPRPETESMTVSLAIAACITGSMSIGFWVLSYNEEKLEIPAIILASICIGMILAAIVAKRLIRSPERQGKDR
jgi:hypothetical protein